MLVAATHSALSPARRRPYRKAARLHRSAWTVISAITSTRTGSSIRYRSRSTAACGLWGCSDRKTIVLTLGREGAADLTDNDYREEPAYPTEGVFRFGSGDAFTAGYLYAYLEGALYRELCVTGNVTPLTFGNAFAALKRCLAGDIASITQEEVKQLLQGKNRNLFR